MKIEKVNDNQIRCTLTREDLADRQIKLSELAYGSEKARKLFRDMIQQANYEFGFEADDIPLMVEAIPLSTESIILVITKVEYPEEMDVRFSNFSEPDEDMGYDEPVAAPSEKGADEVLDIFKKLKEAANTDGSEDDKAEKATNSKQFVDMTKMFEFKNLDDVCRLANVIYHYYEGDNDLYKDTKTNRFYLMLHKSNYSPVEFNKICNRISEYALQKNYTPAIGAYYSEHGNLILSKHAIQTLASL